MEAHIRDINDDAVRMAVSRLWVSSRTSNLGELLVSFTDLRTPMHPDIVSSDFGTEILLA